MRLSIPLFGAALLAASTVLLAQAPQDSAAKAARGSARKACEGKSGDERRECLRRELCRQSQDPAQCEARSKQAAERRAQVHAACQGKQGEELRACLREQRARSTK